MACSHQDALLVGGGNNERITRGTRRAVDTITQARLADNATRNSEASEVTYRTTTVAERDEEAEAVDAILMFSCTPTPSANVVKLSQSRPTTAAFPPAASPFVVDSSCWPWLSSPPQPTPAITRETRTAVAIGKMVPADVLTLHDSKSSLPGRANTEDISSAVLVRGHK